MFGRNFEKTTRTNARLSFEDIEQARRKKGKRNKSERNQRNQWETN